MIMHSTITRLPSFRPYLLIWKLDGMVVKLVQAKSVKLVLSTMSPYDIKYCRRGTASYVHALSQERLFVLNPNDMKYDIFEGMRQ